MRRLQSEPVKWTDQVGVEGSHPCGHSQTWPRSGPFHAAPRPTGPQHPLSCSEGRGGRHPCCREKEMDGNHAMPQCYCGMYFFFFFNETLILFIFFLHSFLK